MLLKFKFKNYKSFKGDTLLDLTATKYSEYNWHIVKIGTEQILPVTAILGPNASGKSNVIDAFRYMHEYVWHSLNYGDSASKNKDGFYQPTPFVFEAKSKDAESLFEIYFINQEDIRQKIYNYGFSIDSYGVVEEWLQVKSKTSNEYTSIFYRNRKKNILDLSGFKTKIQENLKLALENETLLVSLGAKLKVDKLKLVRDWFLNNNFTDFGNPRESVSLFKNTPEDFAYDPDVRKKVVDYLSTFDKSIIDFEVETSDYNEDEICIYAVHKMIDGTGTSKIMLQNESAGTLKMFALYPFLNEVLSDGGVLVIDELNAELHPLLVKAFVEIFTNPKLNIKHAQLIYTTHDAWQLDADLLRRDEIWFTKKDNNGVSFLYSLADYENENGTKIRKDENFEKNYLSGKYGAIPNISKFKFGDDE